MCFPFRFAAAIYIALDAGEPAPAWCYVYALDRLIEVAGARWIPAGVWL